MIDWARVVADDFPVPPDLDGAVEELTAMLADPDPVVRDERAYPVLTTWIRRGVLDHRLAGLGDVMVSRFAHPQLPARTFAPLVLAAAVDRDVVGVRILRGWRDAFVEWWPAEADIRGWDDRLGWLHAVAHGADLAGALGASPRLDPAEAAELLGVAARRVVAPTDYRYAQMEEDRVARAMVRVLATGRLTAEQATGWLDEVDRLFATGAPGPLPAPVGNTLAVLRALYVMADRQSFPSRAALTDAIAQRLHLAFPAYHRTRPTPPTN